MLIQPPITITIAVGGGAVVLKKSTRTANPIKVNSLTMAKGTECRTVEKLSWHTIVVSYIGSSLEITTTSLRFYTNLASAHGILLLWVSSSLLVVFVSGWF